MADGRKIRALAVVDDFRRECPDIAVDRWLPGARLARKLDKVP
jgi:hypothetical protein